MSIRQVRLRHMAQVNPPTAAFDRVPAEDEVTFMPLEAVWSDARLDLSRCRPKAEVASGYVRFQRGDILCPKVTPTFQAGRAALLADIPSDVGAASTEVHVLRARPGVDASFVRYVLLSKRFLEEGASAFQGVAGLQRVPTEFVQDFRVPMTPLNEQRRIADFLDDQTTRIDQILDARRQQVELISAAGQSGIDTALEDLARGSGWTSLRRRLVRIQQGWSPDCDQFPATGDEWGVLKVGAVKRGTFRPEQNKRLPSDLAPRPELQVLPDDLLFTRANTRDLVGDCCVVPTGSPSNLLLCDKIMRVVLDPGMVPSFVAFAALGSRARSHFSALASGTSGSMVNIRGEDIQDMPIPDANPGFQQALVEELSSEQSRTRDRASMLEASMSLLHDVKRSLISTAVSGELDVTTASGRGVAG